LRSQFKTITQKKGYLLLNIIVLYIYIFPNLYSMMSLDYTSYAHIANQLYLSNWEALFNLTWSSFVPLMVSILMRIGINIHIGFGVIKLIFGLLSTELLFNYTKREFKESKNLFLINLLGLLVIFHLIQSITDIVFLYFSSLFLLSTFEKKSISILWGMLTILTRPLGIYIVILSFFINAIMDYNNIKKFLKSITNNLIVLLLTLIWSSQVGKFNWMSATLGLTGKYNLTLVSPNNQKYIFNNLDDKFKQQADIYHSHLLYGGNCKLKYHKRKVDQWKWLDISLHLGECIEFYHFKLSDIGYFIKWYMSNVYIFIKEYIYIIFALMVHFYGAINFFSIKNYSIVGAIFIYLSLFFLTHIELRYVIMPILLIVIFIVKNNNLRYFNNFQYLLIFNLMFLRQWIQIFIFLVSGLKNWSTELPNFLKQRFDKDIQYVSTGNLPASLLVIKNDNLKYVGYIKSRDDYWKIKDSTIALLEFHSDTAYFTYK